MERPDPKDLHRPALHLTFALFPGLCVEEHAGAEYLSEEGMCIQTQAYYIPGTLDQHTLRDSVTTANSNQRTDGTWGFCSTDQAHHHRAPNPGSNELTLSEAGRGAAKDMVLLEYSGGGWERMGCR